METWDQRNCQSFEMASRRFEPGFFRLRARRSNNYVIAPPIKNTCYVCGISCSRLYTSSHYGVVLHIQDTILHSPSTVTHSDGLLLIVCHVLHQLSGDHDRNYFCPVIVKISDGCVLSVSQSYNCLVDISFLVSSLVILYCVTTQQSLPLTRLSLFYRTLCLPLILCHSLTNCPSHISLVVSALPVSPPGWTQSNSPCPVIITTNLSTSVSKHFTVLHTLNTT